MAKINILPAKVYNRIAAGEVVDRPYSVVKELVENAIDAGATEIEIFIEKGGKQLIRVVDNGSGIERDDLQSAFLPHATSKIEKAEDLDTIMTLGFRGEAVASIAAVSKMTITSKTVGGKCYSLCSDGGELGEILETAGANGTDVSVEMLFFNAPVRLKFLKTDKGEETDITNFVSRFILNRSDISFTYYVNGKKVLQSFGGGDEEALISVYGAAVLPNCFLLDAEKHGIRIRGYIGNQNYSKANKSYQSVFLNGRYIVNTTVAAAITNAYSSYLMKRQYPFYVLHIDVPPEIVDVNVHPNKADVRFADNQIIYGCIYSVIAAVLDGQTKALEYIVQDGGKQETFSSVSTPEYTALRPSVEVENEDKKQSDRTEKKAEQVSTKNTFGIATLTYEEAQKELEMSSPAFVAKKQGTELPFSDVEKEERKGFIPADQIAPFTGKLCTGNKKKKIRIKPDDGPERLHKKFPDLFFQRNVLEVNDSTAQTTNAEMIDQMPMPPLAESKSDVKKEEEIDYFAENKRFLEELDAKAKQNKIDVSTCVYAGKLFNTYLLYERQDDVYIIDQHAAHERLIFNRLKEKMQNRAIAQQPMLFPYVLELNAFEHAFICERVDDIREMGFDIEDAGNNKFKVSAIPLDLQYIDLGVFFNDILGDISGYRSIKLVDILKDKIASAACKAAVKGGMDLTREEIDSLFQLMDGDMGLKCPHGRPVVVKMSRTQLEKMFKRIV
ncbi:MAG: DNA mismatch repair endonuclease MutL [Clostridia bacterium]|nr:DNA mismatch repair endonuclease MutL [Clostridia bacterium]